MAGLYKEYEKLNLSEIGQCDRGTMEGERDLSEKYRSEIG